MNGQQLDDLKQFIDSRISKSEARMEMQLDSRISQSEARSETKFEGLRKDIEDLRKEMLEGFAGVGEALDEINKHFDERVTKLEQRAA